MNRACMLLGRIPVSPYRNINEMTPTKGGKAYGNTASEENKSLPGKRYFVNINANGTPTIADKMTLPIEIVMLLIKAEIFALFSRLKNSL